MIPFLKSSDKANSDSMKSIEDIIIRKIKVSEGAFRFDSLTMAALDLSF